MSKLAVQLAKHKQRDERSEEDDAPPNEAKALRTLRIEARRAGATLASGGKGGLPSTLVLGVMRRDKYQCKVCGGRKHLGIHHKGGDTRSKWLSRKGHKLEFNNLVTICEKSHDEVHDRAREDGTDSSQVTPEGDK